MGHLRTSEVGLRRLWNLGTEKSQNRMALSYCKKRWALKSCFKSIHLNFYIKYFQTETTIDLMTTISHSSEDYKSAPKGEFLFLKSFNVVKFSLVPNFRTANMTKTLAFVKALPYLYKPPPRLNLICNEVMIHDWISLAPERKCISILALISPSL